MDLSIRFGFIYIFILSTIISILSVLPPTKYIETGIYGEINDLTVIPAILALNLASAEDTVIERI